MAPNHGWIQTAIQAIIICNVKVGPVSGLQRKAVRNCADVRNMEKDFKARHPLEYERLTGNVSESSVVNDSDDGQ